MLAAGLTLSDEQRLKQRLEQLRGGRRMRALDSWRTLLLLLLWLRIFSTVLKSVQRGRGGNRGGRVCGHGSRGRCHHWRG